MKDYLVKAYAFDKTVRIYAATTSNLVDEARAIHDTWPTVTAALGRVLTASVIMGAMYYADQTLSIQIDGGGPVGKIIATANANGEVRGMVEKPHVHISTADGKLDVGKAVGNNGFIHVTKDLKIRDIFTSSASLKTGEIADDFTYYFAMSEQIPSSVGLGVLVGEDNKVLASGGFILQVMPGIKAETLTQIEQNIGAMTPVSELLAIGHTPETLIEKITNGSHEFAQRLDLHYKCDCSWDKFAKGLITLGKTELESMIAERKPIETICQFCGRKYVYDPEDIEKLSAECLDHNDDIEKKV